MSLRFHLAVSDVDLGNEDFMSNLSKSCIFTDPLLITSYVSALFILFFENKPLFYNDNEQIKLSFFLFVGLRLCCFVCTTEAAEQFH